MLSNYKRPVISIFILIIIITMCYVSPIWIGGNASYMHLDQINQAPSVSYLFGTDNLGRDIFKMIWSGGVMSITIGILSTLISSLIAILYGTISGLSNRFVDGAMMRTTDIILSIPGILLVIFMQALLGQTGVFFLSLVIGLTSWMNMAKMVRSEVQQIKNSDYILSARLMGANIPHIIRYHLIPNFLPSIMFMIITNIGAAMATEATLSFMGIGLSLDTVSWGSMMALSEKALLTNSWWIIIIPGLFLVTTIVCITNIGEYVRSRNSIDYIT